MKKILGLDLGTGSIGWALVNEAENESEKSSIIRLGVRVNPLTVDEKGNFEKGKPITTNAGRTLKRSMRRNLQRYKMRRNNLIELLRSNGWIAEDTLLSEDGKDTTYETLALRAKAATEEISLAELARVLLLINKKRGYRSSRKTQGNEEGQLVDGMEIAKELDRRKITPGQFVFERMVAGNFSVPDFYRSDLQAEFDRVWEFQRTFYPDILTDALKEELRGKNEKQTWAICQEPFHIVGIKREFKGKDLQIDNYRLRDLAVKQKLGLEELAIVLQKINSQLKNSSGYLGAISDHSKELYFKGQTIGQNLYARISAHPHDGLKNIVFYRQDYIDEFDRIWETQSRFHPELTPELRDKIRNSTIFYQRPLRSQKSLIDICEFENRKIEVVIDGVKKTKTVGLKVCPKSSPLFQQFKIWQVINNLKVNGERMEEEERKKLFGLLQFCDKMKDKEVLKRLYKHPKDLELNYKEVPGNTTMSLLFKAYSRILEASGHEDIDRSRLEYDEIIGVYEEVFSALGCKVNIFTFDAGLEGKAFEEQPLFRLWHLLYSFEGDTSVTGDRSLVEKISSLTGLPDEYSKIIAGVAFDSDYGNLSTKALRRILPFMADGLEYSCACAMAGYRHSKKSLTREELESKIYLDHLEELPKNSLRNPVVEKILNQMVNVVNGVIDEYGKPDEVRIELARELKKNAKERADLEAAISKSSKENEAIRKILTEEFGILHPTRNDVIRYRLYMELKDNDFRTLYSNTYIPQESLFSGDFDIEHIIPQARLYDDSFSNKTIESRQINIEKGKKTADDFIKDKYGDVYLADYEARVDRLYRNGVFGKSKRDKLLMTEDKIPSGFIERDLRDTQYIAKTAKNMLEDLVPAVVSTTGSITDRLREDWQLVDVMKELNWDKYERLGMTRLEMKEDGRQVRKIDDWTKRNDQRHHAMDALTIAFTKRAYVQYLNNLNARTPDKDEAGRHFDLRTLDINDLPQEERCAAVNYIARNELRKDGHGKLRFIPPMPLDEFRAEAKRQLEQILVSYKAKNKVVTRNVNRTKCKAGEKTRVQLTPRGQLHNETVYGRRIQYVEKLEKVGSSFGLQKIAAVADQRYRTALTSRLEQYGGDPKKAFTGKNALDKNPIWLDEMHATAVPVKVKTRNPEEIYTIRKKVGPDLVVDKVIDDHIRELLQARLAEYGGDPKKAFADVDSNPIWVNEAAGIAVKSVTIKGVNNAVALHSKKDKDGKVFKDADGHVMAADYVSTSNNHHIAIYRDQDGNLQENVISFFEAVARKNNGVEVIDRNYRKDEGWEFLFTMKQNEYFVFPNPETGFEPSEINLLDPDNYAEVSKNLYRVQKITKGDYYFRHHLETNVMEEKVLRNTTWKRIQSTNYLKGIVKVRINNIGKIVAVGEY